MKQTLVDLIFSDWDVVKTFLLKHQIQIETINGVTRCQSPNHTITSGFNWDTLDIYTRGHQLQFLLFGGRQFLELNTMIEIEYRKRNNGKRNN
jgi:hypothetical protein